MKLTLQETAKLLDLPVGMVERWIRQGRIPIRKSGENCYFEEAVLEKWATTHNLAFSKLEDALPEADRNGLQRLMEWESLTSTGIGNGIAIPHPALH